LLPPEYGAAAPATDAVLETWIVTQGPDYFGLDWYFDEALLQELQLTGQAARLMKKVLGP
jgi:hypothetical protein